MNVYLLTVVLAVSHGGADTVVVCPSAFEQALQPWIDYRQGQGHAIAVVSNRGSAADIRGRIRQIAKSGALKHVLLVGDSAPTGADKHNSSDGIPACYMRSKVTLRWGSEPDIATDNDYADLDDDRVPDVAIGRLTAHSPAELTLMIDKIIHYERNRDFGPWRTRINFVAGAGGFGSLPDKLLERLAGYVISRYVPQTYASSMTYASWQSCFCPDPRRFPATVIERMNEGCALFVYIGHGSERNLAGTSLCPQFRWDSILSADDARGIRPQGGPAIALFLACRTGAYDNNRDCLAEELLRSPGGPVAVIGASRVTMPYGMTVLGLRMINETFENRRTTLGEVLLHAKRRLVPPASARRVGLATVLALSKGFEVLPSNLLPITSKAAVVLLARIIGTSPADLVQERAEHVALFNLFGDPLLRLRYPDPIELDVPRRASPGQEIIVSGTPPSKTRSRAQKSDGRGGTVTTAQARIEVRRACDQRASAHAVRQTFDSADAALNTYDATYRDANNGIIATALVPVRSGHFRASIRLPDDCGGECRVRVVVESADEFAAGVGTLVIDPNHPHGTLSNSHSSIPR